MPIAKRVKKFLEDNGVSYSTTSHPTAYTAQETAASAHIPGREVAKVVILKADDRFVMAVLPAPFQVDLKRFRNVAGASDLSLATEEEFESLFPRCETGAMAPFGNLYELDVFVDRTLAEDEDIYFNAGTHTEIVQMKYSDYETLVRPKLADFRAEVEVEAD
jgi:Ala-tRNA(Pro) deacylase